MSTETIVPTPLRLPDGRSLDFQRTRVMGILNLTPDSFSDGGRFTETEAALSQARALAEAGVDVLDVGAESTRPGSESVSPEEQLRRLLPVIGALAEELTVPISVDTTSSVVAARCLEEGASLVNDISAFRYDPEMIPLLAETGVPAVAMHTGGRPSVMQAAPAYEDVVQEVGAHLRGQVQRCVDQGVVASQVMVDPGIGFGKTLFHNLRLLHHLSDLISMGNPVLVGPSRKRFLGEITGRPVDDRERGTAAICALAVYGGAHMVRVHEPLGVRDALAVGEALAQASRAAPSGVDFHWPPT